jgi:hypothetical protein
MPEPDAAALAAAEAKEAVERIQQIVANARTIWFALLGFLAFIGLTLVSVRDVDFFSLASTTQLPIVNIAIPTTIFFWSAAWLAALMHTYLHLYLLKLWDAVADAPATIGGKPLGDRVFPWLVVEWALRERPDRPTTPRPMDRLADLVSLVVVWAATPAMLTAFWWFSMAAHNARLTVPIAAALVLSVFATANGFRHAVARLNKPSPRGEEGTGGVPPWPRRWRDVGGALAAIVLVVSLVRTEVDIGFLHWSSLADIGLANDQVAQRPANWRDRDVAVRQFRIGWCRDQGLTAQACPPLDQPERIAARARWCTEKDTEDGCDERFGTLAADFDRDWAIERRAYLDTIPGPDLNGRDLRGASANGAFLAGINLREARLEGADLRAAHLEGADLSEAGLEGANLSEARLEEANLSGAGLEGADLRGARLPSAEWAGATIQASPAHSADFTDGRNLMQPELATVIGDGDTFLPRDAATGEQLYVWSCWADPPPTLAVLLRRVHESWHADLRADWLCNERRYPRPEGDQPRRTGRPAPY